MVSKEVKDSLANMGYVVIGILIYLWFVAFILPSYITFYQLVEWLAMQTMLYPLFMALLLIAGRYAISAVLRWIGRRIKGIFGFVRNLLGSMLRWIRERFRRD